MGVETDCKRRSGCRSKTCVFNHPGRQDCRKGDSCQRKDCRFNHQLPICVFFPQCGKRDCGFRHPSGQVTTDVKNESNKTSGVSSKSSNKDSSGIDCSQTGTEVTNIHPHIGWIPQFPQSSVSGNNDKIERDVVTSKNLNTNNNPKPSTSRNKIKNKISNCNASKSSSNEVQGAQSSKATVATTDNKPNANCRGWVFNQELHEESGQGNKSEELKPEADEGSKTNRFKGKPADKMSENTSRQNFPSKTQCKQDDEDAHLLKKHRHQMSSVREKLVSLLSDEDLQQEIRSTKTAETVDALRKQLDEFSKQEKMYKAAVKRAKRTLRGEELELQLKREAFRLKNRLPSLAERKNIEDRLEDTNSRFIVIQGQTGSGKSSQIAQYVADHPRFKGTRVVVTQPRKIAAISLANRVSEEYSGGQTNGPFSRVGKFVGYHVGGQRRTTPTTRIEFVTEGVMLEKIMKGTKEAFEGIGCIVVDEAHERSIMCDILLGSFKNSKDPRWKNILIIVTSATIDLDFFSKFFNNTVPVEIPGRAFPVDITYSPISHDANICLAVVECAFKIHKECKLAPGDILCFLPGQEDVLQAQATFERKSQSFGTKNMLTCQVFALYGKLEPSEQARVFLKQPAGVRKVIFATDVAETSLTIDGVVYVVDSGVKKEMMYDPKRNISSLTVNTISKSSAIQRAGRSGRTQPGHTYRLYSQEDYECMDTSTTPEIFRKPLGLAILSLRDMNIDPNTFEWISVPSREAIQKAEQELRLLGAIDDTGRPTELGSLISISQQEPKLVRMIYKGCESGLGYAAITCASLLPIANIFFRGGKGDEAALEKRKELSCIEGDVVTMYELFQKWENLLEGRGVDFKEAAKGSEEHLMHTGQSQDLNQAHASNCSNSTVWDFLQSVPSSQSLVLTSNRINQEEQEFRTSEVKGDSEESKDDDEDTKSVSQFSEKSSVLERLGTSLQLTRSQREKCYELADDFSRTNYLNRKALGLVKDTRSELLAVFRNTNVWKALPTQRKVPTREDLTRLIFAGYFLNVARQVHSKLYGRRASVHYFGLVSGVYGSLDYKSAIAARNVKTLPEWITFDKVLRLGDTSSVTLLTTATAVPDYMKWIEEESPKFANFCRSTCESLPTEHIAIPVPSDECLRHIFGRFFVNIKAIEDDIDCAMEVNTRACIINVFTSMSQKPAVENYLKRMISNAVTALRHQFIEEEYMGSTRVVLGEGYEVKEILFPQEFITAFLRKIPRSISDKNKLMDFVENAIPSSVIHSVDIRYHETCNFGIVNFKTKEMARRYFPELCSLSDNISEFARKVGGLTKEKKFRSGEVARLKISWPLSPATGKITVTFRRASQANSAIENVGIIFPGARVTNAEGIRRGVQSKYENNSKKFLPIVEVSKIGKDFKFKYIPDEHQPREGLDYKITISNVQTTLDEFEINARLNRYNPKQVRVDRERKDHSDDCMGRRANVEGCSPQDWYDDLLVGMESSVQALEGIQKFRNALTTHNEFLEQNLRRGGVFVYLDDVKTTEEAHKELSLMDKPFPPVFEQPVRVEIEYTKTITVQWDLYEFLRDEINCVLDKAKADGIFISRPNSNAQNAPNQRFATVKLRHKNVILVEKYQKVLLDEVMVCEKIPQGAEHSLLFSWVGKSMLETLGKKRFLHWDVRTQFIWVYGPNNLTRNNTKVELEEILKKLKVLEVLDKEILLDKKKIDFQKDKLKIEDIAYHKAKVTHIQFSGRNRLLVSGSKASTAEFEKILGSRGYLFVKRMGRNKVPDCELCFCECNEENIRLTECGHIFCLECIFPMLNDPTPQVPIACPSCRKPLVIADITRITSNKGAVLRKFVETATLEYASKNKNVIVICPQQGCNQILSLLNFREGPFGGRFVSCDECVSTYCIDCSTAMEKPIMSHERDTCEETRRDFGDDVMRHVRDIQNNIFNLLCPRCKTAFLDFDGCAAVTCSTCNASFCGMCLKDCGDDAHPHVQQCNLQPNRGYGLYIQKPILDLIHRKKRTGDLEEYLMKIESIEERAKVLQALRRDLIDLGLRVSPSILPTMDPNRVFNEEVFRPQPYQQPIELQGFDWPPQVYYGNEAMRAEPINAPRVGGFPPQQGEGMHPRNQVEIDRILALQLEQEEREAALVQERVEIDRRLLIELQQRDEFVARARRARMQYEQQDRRNRCIIT